MTQELSNSPEGLRAMLAHALQAYETAQAMRWKEEVVVSAEQERAGHLLAAIQEVEQAARELLEKTGLAHIAGAPLRLDETAAPVRRNDEAVAAAFASAQLAYTDLRIALFRLGTALADDARWEEAGRVVCLLLDDEKAPLYADARDLLCESYYRSASEASQVGEWSRAANGFRRLARINSCYKDTIERLKTLFSQILEEQEWEIGADIWMVLDNLGIVDNDMMQQLKGVPELQKVLTEKLAEVDLVWSINVETVWSIDYIHMITNRYANKLTFNTGLSLLAVACLSEAGKYTAGPYYSSWVYLLDMQTGTPVHVVKLHEEKHGSAQLNTVQVGSIAFDENDKLLRIFMRNGQQVSLNLSTGEIAKDSGVSVPSESVQSRSGQPVNPQLISALQRELAKSNSALTASVISPDGKWVAAADQALTIYLFHRRASLPAPLPQETGTP